MPTLFSYLRRFFVLFFIIVTSTEYVFADITGCAINGDTIFYPNDLGNVTYAPWSQSIRSFNGDPVMMSNWTDVSSLPCGTYYYDHSTQTSRPNCIAYNNSGAVVSTGGAVTIIKQKCVVSNLPLDDYIPLIVFGLGSLGFLAIRNQSLLILLNKKND